MSAQAEVVKFYKDSLDFSELNESGIYHNSLAYHQSTQEIKPESSTQETPNSISNQTSNKFADPSNQLAEEIKEEVKSVTLRGQPQVKETEVEIEPNDFKKSESKKSFKIESNEEEKQQDLKLNNDTASRVDSMYSRNILRDSIISNKEKGRARNKRGEGCIQKLCNFK